jgi:hypothetical protein
MLHPNLILLVLEEFLLSNRIWYNLEKENIAVKCECAQRYTTQVVNVVSLYMFVPVIPNVNFVPDVILYLNYN